MSLLRGRLLWTGLTTLFALLPGGLSAQSTFATVTGTVTDPAGAVIPGVTLTATHIETNIRTTAQSNEAGVYTIAQLKEGEYTLRAQGAGFKEFVVQNVVLQARDYRRVDIRLEVGGVETKIEVTSGATLILGAVAFPNWVLLTAPHSRLSPKLLRSQSGTKLLLRSVHFRLALSAMAAAGFAFPVLAPRPTT